MIIEKVLGNTHDLPPGPDPYFGLHREKVVLPSAQLVKRIQRVTTDHGKELGIRLPAGSGDLRDGDILATHWCVVDGQGTVLTHRLRVG